MNQRWREQTTPLVLKGGIHMPYTWTVGRVGSRFFVELRNHGRIMGSRCDKCSVVWVPPRLRCPKCFTEIRDENWIEVGPEGTLRHFTIVRYSHPNQPKKPPFAYGIIFLDNANNGITHFVHTDEMDALHSGIRVKPVMATEREGKIMDIAYFSPVGG
jgi:uncharacterized OB-fold protein